MSDQWLALALLVSVTCGVWQARTIWGLKHGIRVALERRDTKEQADHLLRAMLGEP